MTVSGAWGAVVLTAVFFVAVAFVDVAEAEDAVAWLPVERS